MPPPCCHDGLATCTGERPPIFVLGSMAAGINPAQLAQLTGEKRKAEAGAVAAFTVIEGIERHASVLNAANQESLGAVLEGGPDAAAVYEATARSNDLRF